MPTYSAPDVQQSGAPHIIPAAPEAFGAGVGEGMNQLGRSAGAASDALANDAMLLARDRAEEAAFEKAEQAIIDKVGEDQRAMEQALARTAPPTNSTPPGQVPASITLPVVVIQAGGHVLSGTTTAAPSGGHFSVTDGSLTCSGTYDAWDVSPVLSIPVSCSDGRSGVLSATRYPDGMSGSGTVRLNDGSVAKFAFGSAVDMLVSQSSISS
jgi:hypothetical protein